MEKLKTIGSPVYVNSKDIVTHIDDIEIVEGITLFYTKNKSCYIEEQLTFLKIHNHLDGVEKILYNSFVNSFSKENLLLKQIDVRKRINRTKFKENEKITNSITPIVTHTSWLRKIVSHLSKLGRRVRG